MARSGKGNGALSRGRCDRNVTPRQQRAADQMKPSTLIIAASTAVALVPSAVPHAFAA